MSQRALPLHGIQIVLSLAIVGLFASVAANEEYRRPLFSKMEFPSWGQNVSEEERLAVIDELIHFSRNNENASGIDKTKALLLARGIDPTHREAFLTEYQLSHGIDPPPYQRAESGADSPSYHLASFAKKLKQLGDNRSAQFSGYVADMISIIETGEPSGTISWKEFFGPPPSTGTSQASLTTNAEENQYLTILQIPVLTTSGIHPIQASFVNDQNQKFQFSADKKLGTSYLSSGFREGIKYLTLRQPNRIQGLHAHFGTQLDEPEEFFEQQGPAVTLSALVSLCAHISGKQLDMPGVAFAADVNADGTIQPVKDLRERLEQLGKTEVSLIGVSHKDSLDSPDIAIRRGAKLFATHQIFSLKTLEEDALNLAVIPSQRPDELQQAITLFAEIRTVLLKPGGMKFVTNSHVRKRLQQVVSLAPNHVSAKTLLLASNGRLPARLSMKASYELALDAIASQAPEIRSGDFMKNPGSLDDDAVAELNRFKSRLHPKIMAFSSAIQKFDTAGRVGTDKLAARRQAAQNLVDEITALQRDPEIIETLR